MTTEDKDKAATEQAAAQQKDADERAKANEGKFDAEAETAKVRDAVANAPAPGNDPDSRTRLAKTLAASGVDAPDGYTTDPVTDEERQKYAEEAGSNPTTERRAAQPDKVQGRTTRQRSMAAEEK